MWRLAWAGVAGQWSRFAGTAAVVALAAALLAAAGVLVESGLRLDDPAGAGPGAGALAAVAASYVGTGIVVVVLVVASTVGLALRPRQRDFAVLRASGATRSQVRAMVAGELLLITLVVAPLGALPGLAAARLTTPMLVDAGFLADGARLVLSPLPVVGSVLVLVPLVLVAAHLACRETLRLPPTAAIRSAQAEPRTTGRARRVAAVVCAATGLLAAGTPLVVPGTVGGATAASSALLLVGAAALAGPLLVPWLLALPARAAKPGARPVAALALAGSAASARRLTAVVVPLAVVVALGTVQTSTGASVHEAARQQVGDGVRADLVVTSPRPLDAAQVERIRSTAGVTGTAALATLPVRVRTDDEDVPGLEGLSWESGAALVLPSGGTGALQDLGVVDGSTDALDEPGTVAVSKDARLLTGRGVGSRVTVRLGTEGAVDLRVAAVYERGLAFGDYVVGAGTLAAHGLVPEVDTVLVGTDDGAGVEQRLAAAGLQVTDEATFVEAATQSDAQEQRLSALLLLSLLAFVVLGAANALVFVTAGRRDEMRLLGQLGLTRRQLLRMALVESLVTAGAAWVIGTLAVVPAAVGVTFGLLGAHVPVVDAATYGALALVVLVVSVVAVVSTVALRTRPAPLPAG